VQPLQPTADDSRSTVGQTVDSLDSYRKQQEAAGHKMSVMQMAELAMQRTKKKEAARAAARAKVQEAKVQETKKIQAQQAAKNTKDGSSLDPITIKELDDPRWAAEQHAESVHISMRKALEVPEPVSRPDDFDAIIGEPLTTQELMHESLRLEDEDDDEDSEW